MTERIVPLSGGIFRMRKDVVAESTADEGDRDSRLLRFLVFSRNTESDSSTYASILMRTPLRNRDTFVQALPGWLSEELRHAELLDAIMANEGLVKSGDSNPARSHVNDWPHSLKVRLFCLASHMAPRTSCAILLSNAVVNELVAFLAYARMASTLNSPDDRLIMGRMAGDERRHAQMFAAMLEPPLRGFARWSVGAFFRYYWRPVGSASNGRNEVQIVADMVFNIHSSSDSVAKLDNMASKLVGQELYPSQRYAASL